MVAGRMILAAALSVMLAGFALAQEPSHARPAGPDAAGAQQGTMGRQVMQNTGSMADMMRGCTDRQEQARQSIDDLLARLDRSADTGNAATLRAALADVRTRLAEIRTQMAETEDRCDETLQRLHATMIGAMPGGAGATMPMGTTGYMGNTGHMGMTGQMGMVGETGMAGRAVTGTTGVVAPLRFARAADQVEAVCGDEPSALTAPRTIYRGHTYYFCSQADRTRFERNPDLYLGSRQ